VSGTLMAEAEMRSATGFTVVELVVALSLLTIGVLGLLTVAARVSRVVAEGQYYSRVGSLASGQLEQQLAIGCGAATAGELDASSASFAWTLSTDASGLRWMTVIVSGRTRVGTHVDTFTTVSDCWMH
jgi:Tfp pilus assembly protein PilV